MGGDLQQRDAADGGPHGGGGLPGRRLPGRLRVRHRDAARPPRPLPPAGLRHRLLGRRGRDPGADGGRRRPGAVGLHRAAGQVRRDRDGAADQHATCPRCSSGTWTPTYQVVGGFPIPGLASILSDPATGTATQVQGLDAIPVDDRPTPGEVNVTHLAWDVMVGLGTLLFLLTLWYWASWVVRRRHAAEPVVPACGRRGRSPVGGHPRGGLDGERGRAAALDRLREDEGGRRRHRQHRHLGHVRRRDASSTSASASPRSWSCGS